MSKLILSSELLNSLVDGRTPSKDDAYHIYQDSEMDPTDLYKVSQFLRTKNKGTRVTYSRKVFFNLINLCRDTCSYCTYKSEPGQAKVSMLSKNDITSLVNVAKKQNCTEALFVTGERPEQKYQEARTWLKENGFSSTTEYLVAASEIALEAGLFPHTNAGNLTKDEMRQLKDTNVSLGLMLENSSERLSEEGMPHQFAPSKNPKARIKVLQNAGELKIPMTTGLLVGIGENPHELIDSIYAIKEIHDKYQNIQEIILQNFQPKIDTPMKSSPMPQERYFKTLVALTRIILPDMNIQIPPNLSPVSYSSFLSAGINDWGGISPITLDYVNPEFPWPRINDVNTNCADAGFHLRARFPVYPEFFHMVNSDLVSKMSEIADSDNLVSSEYAK
ncbi:7,8-didemethyl-8-hydroxy-5-deazariboflavin synthase subunit 1 [Candidatus Nitrosotalea sp. FS]|uniref:7,8-didemethyl-8-hydroxy-5-deazariboflavin synthase CofG n=1 Tax=Candidatus Nitrosotalea sp. FS TaxID=2341021 RepID=UPI001C4992F3|nr:7,8-didemethyl-8-hydroxy-5-deazariboflavin synthase CofG [Candidatus Nitrosotalea sp. FS]NHH96760.1 7,8-didemethyl-8-hydroxy-5-deazariboflavin synthase subunit 1 [Candidatus Nitrosotalea sp. FS]